MLATAQPVCVQAWPNQRAGATLETNAITYTSNFLRDEIAVAAALIEALNDIAGNDATQKLAAIGTIIDQLRSQIYSASDPLMQFDLIARVRLAQGLDSLRNAANELYKGNEDSQLNYVLSKASDYLTAYQDIAKDAADLGSGVFPPG